MSEKKEYILLVKCVFYLENDTLNIYLKSIIVE